MKQYLTKRNNPLVYADYMKEDLWFTVEDYCKWYTAYLFKDGEMFDIAEVLSPHDGENLWYDHCLLPNAVLEMAKKYSTKIPLDAWRLICGRFISDIFDVDICQSEGKVNGDSLAFLNGVGVDVLHLILAAHGHEIDEAAFAKHVV